MAPLRLRPSLIEAKLRPPRGAAVLLERTSLVDALEAARAAHRLVQLVAPLGSGKTTLLAQWHARSAPAHAVAWLSCDEQDNDPVRFFTYLVAAIQGCVEDFDAYIASRLADQVEVPLAHVSAVLLERLEALPRELTVVLDDLQCLTDAGLLSALAYLVHHAPVHVHWVVASRRAPELDVGRLKLEDELATFGSAELNLLGADVRELGLRMKGLALTAEEAEYLRARTEGWVAGVKLALLSADTAESLRRFTGSHADVVRYLAQAVLHEQPPELQAFLVVSSVVDRMCGDLCGALAETPHGQALLEQLERSQLFIQPLDSEGRWFRFHSVFLDFLRSQLRRDHAARLPALHRAASGWFARHGQYEEALRHAAESQDRAWCAELIALAAEAWLKEGEIEAVQRWTATLSLEEIAQSRALCVAYFVSQLLTRRFTRTATELAQVRRLVEAGDPERLACLDSLDFLRRVLSESTADGETPPPAPGDLYMEATLLNAQAYDLLRQCAFGTARRLAMRARDLLAGTGHVYSTDFSGLIIAIADRAEGDLRAVALSCEQAYLRMRDKRRNASWVNAATSAASMRYEQNRLAEAEALCAQVLPVLSPASTIENFALAYLTLARVRSVQGHAAEALRLLDYLQSVLEGDAPRRFLAQVCQEKVRLLLAEGDRDRAAAVAEEHGLAHDAWGTKRPYEEAWERQGFVRASLLMSEGRGAEALEVLGVLHESAADARYVYRQQPLRAALASCHWQAGNEREALRWLDRALALTRGLGFTRRIYDEVPGVAEVLAHARARNALADPLPSRYWTRFDGLLAARPQAAPVPPQEALTERELQVLRLLAQGLSNKEISDRGQITLMTTKWHLKHVFAKLGVTTRMAAVFRAQELRLLDGQPPSPLAEAGK